MNYRRFRLGCDQCLPAMVGVRFSAGANLAIFMCWLLLAGCSRSNSVANVEKSPSDNLASSSAAEQTKSKGKLGLSVLTMTNPFFKDLADAFQEEATAKGYEVVVTSGEFDVAAQQNQVKDFIVAKCAAIVLCPCNATGIGTAIQEANTAGIPVFTADTACLAPDAKVVSHIASENLGGGRLAAQAMIEALGSSGGKVLILDYKQGESCLLRVQGFKEVVAKHNSDHPSQKIDIVAELPGDGKRDQGFKCTEDALQTHPDLNGIFAINDPSALGAIAAIEKANKAGQIKIVAFDGQPEGIQAIEEGKIFDEPQQFPKRIGQMTAQTIARYFDGEKIEAVQLIPTELYRKSGRPK